MPSLLDAINARKSADQAPPAQSGPLIVDAFEWAHFLKTGMCPFEDIGGGLYQHVTTRQTYRCWEPYVLPEDA